MKIRLFVLCCVAAWATAFVTAQQQPKAPSGPAPTYSRDVAPILYKHCTECHRPGEIAPMSLMTYKDVRPYAKAIRDEISAGNMPPWHADAAHGVFRNERRLTPAEKETLTAWVRNGAPEGNPAHMPKAPVYTEGWRIGKPDAVFTLPKPYAVKADGMIDYQYFDVPTNFPEDKFVKAIEIRPGNREVVHHALVFVRVPPGGPRRQAFTQPRVQQETPEPVRQSQENAPSGPSSGLLATFAPGIAPMTLPDGAAFRLRAGTTLVFQMHYTTNGTAATDQTQIGFVFADAPPKEEVRASHFFHGGMMIPAGAADHRVDAEITFADDMKIWGLFPHTHLRGKKWHYELQYPDGRKEVILSVPKYDFNWQNYYEFTKPLIVPKGTKLVASAWYDNSPGNPSNPDPKSDVRWGEQTWEEMQYTGLLISFVNPLPTPPVR